MSKSLSWILGIVCVIQVVLGAGLMAGSRIFSVNNSNASATVPPEGLQDALYAIRNEGVPLNPQQRQSIAYIIESDQELIQTLEDGMHKAASDLLPVGCFLLLLPSLCLVSAIISKKPQDERAG